jgi:organic hydroperoxide reductase OsmC/OhrA
VWLRTLRESGASASATGSSSATPGPTSAGQLGPSSPELLCGVLSTCLTHTYEIEPQLDILSIASKFAAAQNNDARFLGIETADPALPWNITAHVRVQADGVPAELIERLHQYARERCPLTQLIKTPNDVTVVVES